jgi:hypothetical protein
MSNKPKELNARIERASKLIKILRPKYNNMTLWERDRFVVMGLKVTTTHRIREKDVDWLNDLKIRYGV